MTGLEAGLCGDDEGGGDADDGDCFGHQPEIPYGRAGLLDVRDVDVPAAIGYAMKRLGDHGAAEDVVAVAFAELAQHWQRKGGLRAPRALLFRIVAQRATDELRSRARRPRLIPVTDEVLAALTAKNIMNVPELQDGLFTSENVQQALAALPVRQRQVLEHRFGFDLELDETAALLAMTKLTVKSLQQRALATLRVSPLLAGSRTTAPEVSR